MKLANPVKDFVPRSYPNGDVTQWFGENPQLYKTMCNPSGCMVGGHNGIDIVRPHGTDIFCVEPGRVAEVKDSPNGYGKHVRLLSSNFEWTYGHLSKTTCSVGQYIERGGKIGEMGNTGFVVSGATPYWRYNPFAGTHLHLGKRCYKRWDGNGTYDLQYPSGDRISILNYNNGTFGSLPIVAEDFEPDHGQSVQEKDLTVQSLLNVAASLESSGKKQQAAIVRAVAAVVRAFI